MITRMERPTATTAFLPPRRRAMRRERSPRKVWVLPAATAASPRILARYRLPCPVDLLPLGLPADSLIPGANRAQEARQGSCKVVRQAVDLLGCRRNEAAIRCRHGAVASRDRPEDALTWGRVRGP